MYQHILLSVVVGLFVSGFVKLGLWIYEVKTNHLPHLLEASQETRDAVLSLRPAIDNQTNILVGELRELRGSINSHQSNS